MPEKEFQVIPKKILYQCDDCKEGWLVFINQSTIGIDQKPRYQHQCSKCKKLFELKQQYPMIKFNEVKEKIINEN